MKPEQETLPNVFPRHRVVSIYSSEQFSHWTAREKAGEIRIYMIEAGRCFRFSAPWLWRLTLTEFRPAASPAPSKPKLLPTFGPGNNPFGSTQPQAAPPARYQMTPAELEAERKKPQKATQQDLIPPPSKFD